MIAHRNLQARARASRIGFTLLEVLAALTITALVTTIAGAALRAGLDVRDRVTNNRDTVEAESRVRAWLTDMLRHAASPSEVDGAIFQLIRRNDVNNVPADAFTLMSVGVEPPYGAGTLWRVDVHVAIDGLHVRATPMGRDNTRATIETVLPHVSGLRVDALESRGIASDAQWRPDWPLTRVLPTAVRLSFVSRDGSAMSPLVVVTTLIAGASQ